MNQADRDTVLEHARPTGNVSKTCRFFGVSSSALESESASNRFYWKRQVRMALKKLKP